MIGKTTKGSGFREILSYVFEKEQAEYIGGNMLSESPDELAAEFCAVAARNHRVQFPLAHISFSPSPKEHLDNLTALSFADRYMKEIDFDDCQWVLAKHSDTKSPSGEERPHFHIIANRVKMTDASVVTAWLDWERSEKALRKLEKEFGLIEVAASWETERSASSTGQKRREMREKEEFEKGLRDRPPEPSICEKIQDTILATIQPGKPISKFLSDLDASGVKSWIRVSDEGALQGISYSLDGVAFSGSKLGRNNGACTITGLLRRGVALDLEKDAPAIAAHTAPQPQIDDAPNQLIFLISSNSQNKSLESFVSDEPELQLDKAQLPNSTSNSNPNSNSDNIDTSGLRSSPIDKEDIDRAVKDFASPFISEEGEVKSNDKIEKEEDAAQILEEVASPTPVLSHLKTSLIAFEINQNGNNATRQNSHQIEPEQRQLAESILAVAFQTLNYLKNLDSLENTKPLEIIRKDNFIQVKGSHYTLQEKQEDGTSVFSMNDDVDDRGELIRAINGELELAQKLTHSDFQRSNNAIAWMENHSESLQQEREQKKPRRQIEPE